MQNAAELFVLVRPQNVHHVSVRVAVVNDNRQIQLLGQLDLPREPFLLHVDVAVEIVVIEPDFPDGDDFFVLFRQFSDRGKFFLRRILCQLRMNSDRRINLRILPRQRQRRLTRRQIFRRADDVIAHVKNARQHRLPIIVKRFVVQMRMRIKEFHFPFFAAFFKAFSAFASFSSSVS